MDLAGSVWLTNSVVSVHAQFKHHLGGCAGKLLVGDVILRDLASILQHIWTKRNESLVGPPQIRTRKQPKDKILVHNMDTVPDRYGVNEGVATIGATFPTADHKHWL